MVRDSSAAGGGPPGSPPSGRVVGQSAVLGLALVAGLALVGAGLVTLGGGPTWPRIAFLLLGLLALAAYGFSIYPHFRDSERRLPKAHERWASLEAVLLASFDHLQNGDLVRSIEDARRLPRGLATKTQAASEALAELARKIQDSSIQIAAAADTVNHIAAELASGSSQQAASVVEITAAMEQLARTASQIAESAAGQAALAARAETSGDTGSVAVLGAVGGVEEVQKRISAIASRADALGTRSKEIYRVLDLITEIAQETHILSLNAAIEAAAAGADGRRFSVVAEEVRRLAQRSQDSVDSVRGLLDEFAGSIRATIVATEEGSKEATRVLERSRSAAGAIGELRRVSGDAARVARQISMATQQQNSASDEVVMTLREVSLVVQRMTSGLKDLSATADRLGSLGLTIQLLAQSFHLESPRSLKHLVEGWARRIEPLHGNLPAQQHQLDELLRESPFVELAYTADIEGKVRTAGYNAGLLDERQRQLAVDGLREMDGRQRPWFKAVSRTWHTAVIPPYQSIQQSAACFTVCTPLRDLEGNPTGVLGIDINVNEWRRI